MGYIYSNTKKLKKCDFGASRGVGIKVSAPFKNSINGHKYVDIEIDRPALSIVSFGKVAPFKEWEDHKDSLIASIARNIDDMINELTEHRERLLREITNQA